MRASTASDQSDGGARCTIGGGRTGAQTTSQPQVISLGCMVAALATDRSRRGSAMWEDQGY